jgi:glycosyltransferase involved in cell wall biosynthesis
VQAATRAVTLRQLIDGQEEHFALSDLLVYHYPGHYSLIESIRGIDRGIVVFYYHNVTPPELWGSNVGRHQLMRGIQGSAMVHYADLCIVDSPFSKQDLVERTGYAPDLIHVLPLAVDTARFSPGAADPELIRRYGLQGHQVLLFVGRMAGNKRIDLLIEVLARVRSQIPNVKLLLVGDDRSNPAFPQIVSEARSRAVDLGVAEHVIWTGLADDLVSHYRLANVYVTASLHEGFAVPLIEAMACGLPVVATQAGAMPWVVGDAGYLCHPGAVDDLAGKVLALLREAGLRRKLIERGLERARSFNRERYEIGLAQIVDEAVANRLPGVPSEPPAPPGKMRTRPALAASWLQKVLGLLAREIQAHGDIALRDYEVRSGVSLLGPLIVWIRRNLTSHLREPYLDPIIERQVSLNLNIAEWIGHLTQAWIDAEQQRAQLVERVEVLEAQVDSLLHRLCDVPPQGK